MPDISDMTSLQLSDVWDLTLTPGGNLQTTVDLPRVLQDVACYERVFRGEGYFDTLSGVPYLDRELGYLPPEELVRERANRRGREVPDVADVSTVLTELRQRVLHGTIYVTTVDGRRASVIV